MKHFTRAAPMLLLLAACSGGGTTVPLGSGSGAGPAQSQDQLQTAIQSPSREALLSSGQNDRLYIANSGNNSITVYWHAAAGNTAPLAVIAGARTGITNPGQLAKDSHGNLFVANGSSVLVFAGNANGNVAPIRTLSGPLTGIHGVRALTVDPVSNALFVVDTPPFQDGASSLLRFAPNAAGNTAPIARSQNSIKSAHQLSVDSTGSNIIEGNAGECCNSNDYGIDTYPRAFANGASLFATFSISSFPDLGVADDPTTRTYLASHATGIYRFAERTVGVGPDNPYTPASYTPAPVSVITNDTCSSQLAVATGPAPYTYAVHSRQTGCAADAVVVYPNSASGTAVPVRTLSGPATLLSRPAGIYEGP